METAEEKTEHPTFRESIRAVWRHVRPYKRELGILLGLGVLSAVANGAVPYVTGRFFDALVSLSRGEAERSGVPLWAMLLGIWALVQIVANNSDWIIDRLRRKVDTGMEFAIRNNGIAHLLRLPLSFHRNEKVNGVLERISRASWQVTGVARTVLNIAPQFLSIIIGITLAASINRGAALILFAGVALYCALLLYILRPIAAIDHEAHTAWNRAWNDAASAVHQIDSVKNAAAEEYEVAKTNRNFMEVAFGLWYRLERNWSNVGFFQRTIVFFTQFAIFGYSIQLISEGAISVGELTALNGYAMMFFGPFVQLGYSWQTVQNGLTTAVQLEEVYREEEESYHPEQAKPLGDFEGGVVFENVAFRYKPEEPLVLSGVTFDVKPGESVAFVGESGVGKSTLVSLVSGYYFPEEGSVRIDGVDTRHLDLTELRSHIAVVPQEVALFNDSIEENIKYGTFDATHEQVVAAAQEAQIDEFIEGLPNRYATIVGERGVKLSVGQKQRVAIARAVLRDPGILVLDEPTSALDSKTERAVTSALDRLMKGRTTFIIAHRLSTVRKADKIFYVEEGKILEAGSHHELMAIDGGKYRKLYEMHVGLH